MRFPAVMITHLSFHGFFEALLLLDRGNISLKLSKFFGARKLLQFWCNNLSELCIIAALILRSLTMSDTYNDLLQWLLNVWIWIMVMASLTCVFSWKLVE